MKYLIQLAALLILTGCKTDRVINNARPSQNKEDVNNIANALEIPTGTWVPWYIMLVILLTAILIVVWKDTSKNN
jgi:hypothetical protein